MVTNYLTLDSV